MKVALIGYGKMGKAIDQLLEKRGHQVVARIGSEGPDPQKLAQADVAIEFSLPEVAVSNLEICFEQGLPVVCGTTGWLDEYKRISELCEKSNAALLVASNFSLGVNIFFEINRQLARIMDLQEQYEVAVEEIHHTEKKDAPSGTAISLAEDLIKNLKRKQAWHLGDNADDPANSVLISAKREVGVPGTHLVSYHSEIDDIEIKHTAHSRKGFALGAVLAAEFLHNKEGIYSMKDVLNL